MFVDHSVYLFEVEHSLERLPFCPLGTVCLGLCCACLVCRDRQLFGLIGGLRDEQWPPFAVLCCCVQNRIVTESMSLRIALCVLLCALVNCAG